MGFDQTKQYAAMVQSKSLQKLSPVPPHQSNNVSEEEEEEQHEEMVPLSEYNRLKEELVKWQSTAHRWQHMANQHEHSHEAQEQHSKQKDAKYKSKIRDQQNEIVT